MLGFIYIYRIDIDDIFLAEINMTFIQQYTFKFYKYAFKQHQAQATKYFEAQATSMASGRCPVQSVAIFKLFFVDAFNWTFLYLFLLPSLEIVVNF